MNRDPQTVYKDAEEAASLYAGATFAPWNAGLASEEKAVLRAVGHVLDALQPLNSNILKDDGFFLFLEQSIYEYMKLNGYAHRINGRDKHSFKKATQ